MLGCRRLAQQAANGDDVAHRLDPRADFVGDEGGRVAGLGKGLAGFIDQAPSNGPSSSADRLWFSLPSVRSG
jgi:hypothetical protein